MKTRWEEMLPHEFAEAMDECPVCLFAYGLAEPHGPYNALGLDYVKARGIVDRSAERDGGIVAPPMVWHVGEMPHFDFFGSHGIQQSYASTIPGDLFYHVMLHHIRVADARGFRTAMFITGHYGGIENDMRLLAEYYLRRTGSPMRIRVIADWELVRYGDYSGDHAGIVETSQLMYLRPDLVDLSRDVDSSPFGGFAGTAFPLADGRMPSEELGREIVESQIATLGEFKRELLGTYVAKPAYRAPSSDDVEAIWTRFERATRRYWFASATLDDLRNGCVTPFPGWEAIGE